MDKVIFQSKVKEHADKLDMERGNLEKQGIKKASLLEDLSRWWVTLLRWKRVKAICKSSQIYLNATEI